MQKKHTVLAISFAIFSPFAIAGVVTTTAPEQSATSVVAKKASSITTAPTASSVSVAPTASVVSAGESSKNEVPANIPGPGTAETKSYLQAVQKANEKVTQPDSAISQLTQMDQQQEKTEEKQKTGISLPQPEPVTGAEQSGSQVTMQNGQEVVTVPKNITNRHVVFLPPLPGMPKPMQEVGPQSFPTHVIPSSGMVLTPKEIEQAHELDLETAMANAKTPDVKAKSVVIPVKLAPGNIPTPVETAYGYITAINIVDSEGNPWPIQSFAVGNSFQFSVQSPAAHGSKSDNATSSLWVYPLRPGASTNVAIMLVGQNTPIIIPLKSSLTHADYRATIQIDHLGPDAKAPIFTPSPDQEVAGGNLLRALQGIAPKNALHLHVSGINRSLAWRVGNTLYLRTPYQLVSPSWTQQGSADGYNAYKLTFAPALLVSAHGRIHTVSLSSDQKESPILGEK